MNRWGGGLSFAGSLSEAAEGELCGVVWRAEVVAPRTNVVPHRHGGRLIAAPTYENGDFVGADSIRPQSLPLGGRCPSGHTGADEGKLAAWFAAPRSSHPTQLSSAMGAASQPRQTALSF